MAASDQVFLAFSFLPGIENKHVLGFSSVTYCQSIAPTLGLFYWPQKYGRQNCTLWYLISVCVGMNSKR